MKTTRFFLPAPSLALALAALAFVVTGCVGVLPFPVSSSKVVAGRQLKPEDVAFIQPGITTRAQVVARLGTDYAALPYQRAIAYSWEMKGGGGVYWVAGLYGGTGGEWVGGWRGYFVGFDPQGVVRAEDFATLATSRSLHANLEGWAAKHVPVPPEIVRK